MEVTAQTQAEADRVDLVYQAVLAQIGVSTSTGVLTLWQDVPVGQAANAASLLGKAVSQILSTREKARDFGLAYYRLVRALRTGTTIIDPRDAKSKGATSLELLRQEFEVLVTEFTGHGPTAITASTTPDSDADSVDMEPVPGLDKALEADSKAAEPYVKELLTDLLDYSSKTIDALPDSLSNGEAKAKAKELHLQHGAMLAAASGKAAMNGSRNATNQASVRDSRVLGWIRISDGDPCYWCAMLISRGAVYKNQFTAGAGAREDGRVFLGDGLFKFHDNCGCSAEPVYVDSLGWQTDPKYAENRYYRNLWDAHIKDKYSGDLAMSTWRELINSLRKQKKTAAPEAA